MHRSELKVLGFRTLSPEAHRVIVDRARSLDLAVSDYLQTLVKLDCAHHVIEALGDAEDVLEKIGV